MALLNRPVRAGAIAVLGVAMTAMTGVLSSPAAMAAAPAAGPHFAAISGSLPRTTDASTGGYHSARMSIEVALAPRNEAGLNAALKASYTKGSGSYHQWLARGQFDKRFAPTAAARSAVVRYLARSGLVVRSSSSPFLVRATGSSTRVSAAFRTTLRTLPGPPRREVFLQLHGRQAAQQHGAQRAGRDRAVQHDRERSMTQRAKTVIRPAGKPAASAASCENGYPSAQTLLTSSTTAPASRPATAPALAAAA